MHAEYCSVPHPFLSRPRDDINHVRPANDRNPGRLITDNTPSHTDDAHTSIQHVPTSGTALSQYRGLENFAKLPISSLGAETCSRPSCTTPRCIAPSFASRSNIGLYIRDLARLPWVVFARNTKCRCYSKHRVRSL